MWKSPQRQRDQRLNRLNQLLCWIHLEWCFSRNAVHPPPHLLEWRDEAGDADDASVGKELGHFTDAANILLPVLGGKPQVLVQPCPDVVTVQYISGNSPTTEVLLKGKRNGCLASSRETCRESDSKVNRGVCALCVCVHTKLRYSTPQSSAGSDHKKGQVARGH